MNDSVLENKLSPRAQKAWLISEVIGIVIGFIVLAVLFWLDFHFAWPVWIGWILIALTAYTVLDAVWSLIKPKYLYESWRYQVDEEYIQLSYGILKKEWVTVPIAKVQSISTRQGPILRIYQLREIKVETMGSSHAIPALDEQVAIQLKDTLAEYAKLKEVDE
ncbi:PH domain-containing protein [Aquibacillus kalidii]|uniref:PH domain-containing protein n=1 Tax=Aquibacillus kalidii TaxID=2762597 RepID=UPI0016465D2D|nr:PH domain-containing protein [Aquibacillus kalidii]